MTGADLEKIISRAAVLAASTPDFPATVDASVINTLRIISPDIYKTVQEKIRDGSYIVVGGDAMT